MSDKIFCDTNVCLYALHAEEPLKAKKAESNLSQRPTISTQVLGETANTMLKKFRYSVEDTERNIRFLSDTCDIVIVELADYLRAFAIFRQYSLSWWDSLLIATALRSGCSILQSEDMQHGLSIEGQLKIVNPFR
jgi:predicted nucleic acid-binding protein